MPRKVLPRIETVEATGDLLTIRVRWRQGCEDAIDLSPLVNAFKLYTPLRGDAALFRKVKVGERATDIVWTDEIDMSNDTLWRLAQEQSARR